MLENENNIPGDSESGSGDGIDGVSGGGNADIALSDFGVAALELYAFGLRVVPVVTGGVQVAVKVAEWLEGLSEGAIRDYWLAHPEHEVALWLGNEVVVLCANGKTAGRALFAIEQANDAMPNMVFRSDAGTLYVFGLGAGVVVPTGLEGGEVVEGGIGVASGSALVLMPPSAGVAKVMCRAANAGELTVATQAMLDAIAHSNAALVPAVVAGAGGDLAVGMVSGNGGEGGGHSELAGNDTPFTSFTAPVAASAETNYSEQDAADSVPASAEVSAPVGSEKGGEAGEGGVAQPAASEGMSTALAMTSAASLGVPDSNDVLTPKALVNPVVQALQTRGLYITPLGSGAHRVTCPLGHEHGDGPMQDATYVEPDEFSSTGVFRCDDAQHAALTITDLLENLGVAKMDARNKPVIRVVPGELHAVVDAAERQLAIRGKHYQHGGFIVSVTTDPATGNPTIVPSSVQAVTRELSVAATWEKQDGRNDSWVPCDPPARPIAILHNATDFRHLPVLAGVARQPYFAPDGTLVSQPGYSVKSKVFSVFDPAAFAMPAPTMEAAREALALLESLIYEFHFAKPCDKAAMLSGILTAASRYSLQHAPAYHAKAHDIGSGKTYACELICTFASPAPSEKVSYPTTSEEATKVILSLLMKGPAVVEFDDMDSDWLPHGSLKRMLTAEQVTDRILGYSKTATVSTKTLFLGSGNNVGPIGDMRRRVVTINLDPQCATPTTLAYKNDPVATVKQNRGKYVAAALTIIAAWRVAGCPRANVSPIATYGVWSDYCREPLLWLGYADPATSLLDQVQNDPDSDPLLGLLTAWWGVFRSSAIPLRKALEVANSGEKKLLDAFHETPAEERGSINRTKLGWYLKKNAGRIVGGMKFVETTADGRKGWMVVRVGAHGSVAALAPVQESSIFLPDDNDDDLY